MKYDVAVGEGVIRMGKVDAKDVRQFFPSRVEVHELQAFQGKGPQKGGHHAAHKACAHHRDPVSQARAGLPQCVDRSFHRSGEHCAGGGDVVGDPGE